MALSESKTNIQKRETKDESQTNGSYKIRRVIIKIMEYYSTIKKNKIMPFAATWMTLEMVLSEVNQKEKDRYHKISLTCRI